MQSISVGRPRQGDLDNSVALQCAGQTSPEQWPGSPCAWIDHSVIAAMTRDTKSHMHSKGCRPPSAGLATEKRQCRLLKLPCFWKRHYTREQPAA
eukprot:632166-Pelagomonas_calceolata.AAC.1